MEPQKVLEEFGLSQKEARIYLTLLKEHSLTAAALAKMANIQRTTAYLELDRLLAKGLVSYVVKEGRRYYQAASPDKMIEILDTKKAKIKAIQPQLLALHKAVEPFKFEVYEGLEGIRSFYQDMLNSGEKEILAFGVTGYAFEVLDVSFPEFLKKAMKAGLTARYIANYDARKALSRLPFRIKVRYTPKDYAAEVTTVIYKNKVAIQSLRKENLYVVLISDRRLYQSYKNYFELMWNALPKAF